MHHINSFQGCSEVIFQKKYSIYFFSSLILVILYGFFALYVIASAQWGQIVMPDDAFGAALGRRVLTARVIGIVTLLTGFVVSLFYPEIFGRFMVLAVIWSWISFIDDTPPEIITGQFEKSATFNVSSKLGPCFIPSRLISV